MDQNIQQHHLLLWEKAAQKTEEAYQKAIQS